MAILICYLFCMVICLCTGYVGGFEVDEEISFLDYEIRRQFSKVRIQKKWKKLFKFYYLVPNEVYLSAFLIQVSGIAWALTATVYLIIALALDCINLHTFFIMAGGCTTFLLTVCILHLIKRHRVRRRIKRNGS